MLMRFLRQPLAAFRSFASFSAPTHSFANAHHSTQDVPMGRAFRWPHFLQAVSGSSLQISIFSPHFWHRISSGLGERISMLPGHPSLNMTSLYSNRGNISMIGVIPGFLRIRNHIILNSHANEPLRQAGLDPVEELIPCWSPSRHQ